MKWSALLLILRSFRGFRSHGIGKVAKSDESVSGAVRRDRIGGGFEFDLGAGDCFVVNASI